MTDLTPIDEVCDKVKSSEADLLFSANVEIDNLRKMLADAKARGKGLEDLVREVLSNIESGRLASIGGLRNTYTPQIGVEQVARWRETLDPKPVPMCRPDALDDLFPPASGDGRPT